MEAQRQVKIVATVGPASASEDRLEALLQAGVDVFRLNFSHGTQQEHLTTYRRIQDLRERLGRGVAVLVDLPGPKIRTGPLRQGGPVSLHPGSTFTITTQPVEGDAQVVSTTFADLPRHVKPGQRLLLDDGNLELQVTQVSDTEVRSVVAAGGLLGEHKGITLPEALLDISSLTEQDLRNLALSLDLGVDYVAASFVQRAQDIQPIRSLLRARRAQVPIIAKIERRRALANLDSILEAFDGVMVARGDLGVEASPEEVPVWQKQIIRKANASGKLVITATQMLESMIEHPRPTRAEASDVANAVWDGTDAVMLSGETAIGRYPVEAVATMARIIHEAELPGWFRPPWEAHPSTHAEAIGHAACNLARELEVAALVVFTTSGRTAQLVSKARPPVPILAMTEDPGVCRRLALWWGVRPFLLAFRQGTEEMVAATERFLMEQGAVREGDTLVLVGSTPMASRGRTNFVKVHRVRKGRRAQAEARG